MRQIRSPCKWLRDWMWWAARVEAKLDAILHRMRETETMTMAILDELVAQVAENTSVEQSAILLIEGIAAQLAAAGTDGTKLAELKARLATSATALAAAVAANTVPAAPVA